MKKADYEFTFAKSAPLSDAEMAAVLANAPWAKMEREARNVMAIDEFREEDCFQEDRCA